jgi:hypothetical protein
MLAADLDESHMNKAPFEGANPPVWILGHLAVCTDYAGRMLGLERACPRDWHVKFAPGSKPSELAEPLPSKADLMTALEQGHQRVTEAMPNANADVLTQPHAVEILKQTVLKTNGDVLAHLLTTHPMFHNAQLSACRRKSGKGPIV